MNEVIQNTNISTLKHLDHQVGIDDLYDLSEVLFSSSSTTTTKAWFTSSHDHDGKNVCASIDTDVEFMLRSRRQQKAAKRVVRVGHVAKLVIAEAHV